MKKIFKYSFLLMAVGLTFVSCKEVDDYTAGKWNAEAGYAELYFPVDKEVIELDPKDPTTANILVARRNTSGALTVDFDQLVNTDDVFTVGSATFADGDSLATLSVSFPNAVVGTTYNLELTTTDTRYVSAYSDSLLYNMTVTRVKWNPAGYMIVSQQDLADRLGNGDGTTRPYYVEDENGNVVPISHYAVGDTIKGWVRYTDDFITGIYGVENVTYPVKFQQRDDKPEIYRLVNAYATNYYANYPGDWDTSKDYYMILHVDDEEHIWMEYNPASPELGLVWSYGHFILRPLSGYYYDEEDPEAADGYYGKYENGAITFPADAFHIGMAGYSTGGFRWYANGSGKFRVVLDPNLDLYQVSIEDDLDYTDVFNGIYTTQTMLGTSTATLQKGTPNEEIAAMLEAKKATIEDGDFYRIVAPYAEGYDIYFGVDEDGKIFVPEGYRLQPIGQTDNVGNDIYAKIDQTTSTFSSNEIVLTISFVNADETINYGANTDEDGNVIYQSYTEVLANITWTKIATGTFYYLMFSEDEEGGYDPDEGYELFKRDDKDDTFKIADWLFGTDFMFTWNQSTNACVVLEQAIDYTHPSYGPMYIIEGALYNSERYGENTSYYDPETGVFHFFPAYFVSAGSFGQVEELFQITETGGVKRLTPTWGNAKLNRAIRKANRWHGTKVNKASRFALRSAGQEIQAR